MDSPATAPSNNHQNDATWAEGLKDSLPIVISYIPVAFAFGLNATKLGFTPLESLFFSCIIYAGASQFVITALLAAGSSLWVAALTVMAMDVRHVLYGPSLRQRITCQLSKSKTAIWAFGLTDEVFAAATAKLVRDNRRWSENWMIGIAFSSWFSWILGTALGAWSGNGLLDNVPAVEAALGFMLPALFMSFLLASFQRKQSWTVTASLAGALLGVTLVSIPAAILAGIVCGCLAALVQAFIKESQDEYTSTFAGSAGWACELSVPLFASAHQGKFHSPGEARRDRCAARQYWHSVNLCLAGSFKCA